MSKVKYKSDKQNMKFFLIFMFVLLFLISCVGGGYYYYQNNNVNSTKQRKIAKNNAESIIQTATTLKEAGRYQDALEVIGTLDEEFKDMAKDLLVELEEDLFNELVGKVRKDISKGKYYEAVECIEKSNAGTEEQRKKLLEGISTDYWRTVELTLRDEVLSYENKLILLAPVNTNYFDESTYDEYRQVYATLKDGYIQEVIANVQANADNKKEQLIILNNGCELLGDEPILVSMRDDIQAELDEDAFQKAKSIVDETYKSGGYPTAIEKARNLTKENSGNLMVKELETEYVARYVEETMNDVESIYKAGGIDEVITTLQTVYSITDDAKIKNEISLWKSRTNVVKLIDVEPFHKEGLFITDTLEEDNWGNGYNSHIYVSDYKDSGYIEYNVKNIDEPQLQFMYYVPDYVASRFPEDDDSWNCMSAKVYGDDVEIWSSGNANQKMDPQFIRLDVSDYSFVKIYMTKSYYDGCHMGDLRFCW